MSHLITVYETIVESFTFELPEYIDPGNEEEVDDYIETYRRHEDSATPRTFVQVSEVNWEIQEAK